MRSKMKSYCFIGSLSLWVSACTVGHEDFECPNDSAGYGCKSIKQVHELVNNKTSDKVITPVVSPVVGSISAQKLDTNTVSYSDAAMVDRTREEKLRIWIAPFQDEQGNFHEPSVIHTVIRPSYWQMNTINWNS